MEVEVVAGHRMALAALGRQFPGGRLGRRAAVSYQRACRWIPQVVDRDQQKADVVLEMTDACVARGA
jgi:hypothetical protein